MRCPRERLPAHAPRDSEFSKSGEAAVIALVIEDGLAPFGIGDVMFCEVENLGVMASLNKSIVSAPTV